MHPHSRWEELVHRTPRLPTPPPAHLFASLVGVIDGAPERPPTCPVTVNHHDVEALLDSGSRVILVRRDLVDPSCLTLGKVLPVSMETPETTPPRNSQ